SCSSSRRRTRRRRSAHASRPWRAPCWRGSRSPTAEMSDGRDLKAVLATLDVAREPGVFVVAKLADGDDAPAGARAALREHEGLTVVLPREDAVAAGLPFVFEAAWLTLTVDTSWELVGLTAAVAARLAEAGIPANVLAGYHHDHVLVPVDRADDAIAALRSLRA